MRNAEFRLVRLTSGTRSVYSSAYDERMHPGLGPVAEAETLYVRQLKIRERMQSHAGEFVVWDVGLGAAANALTLLHLTRDLKCPLRLVSFDDTAGPLEFALKHAAELGYFHDLEAITGELLARQRVEFNDRARNVTWEFRLADFPSLLAAPASHDLPKPHAIMFDAFSPAKNPAMWTLPLFTNLFRLLDPARPCNLTTYSRSTMLRVTLLLAGFYVGRGGATGLKEETTVAANTLALLDDALDGNWLERAGRSGSAEPLHDAVYRQGRLSAASWDKLQAHVQFSS